MARAGACLHPLLQAKSVPWTELMRLTPALLAAAVVGYCIPSASYAVSLDQACQRFAEKLSAAQASGDQQNVQKVYAKGSQRIASKFNGATCPNVQSPTP